MAASQPQPSMQAVADLAGVHRTTVSLSLRDHPRIPPATRARVQEAARSLGYQIHPLVSALMHAKRTMTPLKSFANLAWITAWPTCYGWRAPENSIPDFYPGAALRAEQLAYKLEHFWLKEPGMTASRMSHIIHTRGISGVILGRLPPGLRKLELQWDQFAAVSIGVSLDEPRLSHVADNHFHACKLAFQTCVERDYQRVGLALPHKLYERVQEKYLGAYLAEQMNLPAGNRLPPLLTSVPHEPTFTAWLKKYTPDVVLCPDVNLVNRWLERSGRKVPTETGIAGLALDKNDGTHAGVWADPAIVGGMAVELVVSLLHRNERGLPAHEQEILYRPLWIDGKTLRSSKTRA